MALASSLHFAGYEFARSGTIALFTSEKMGFASPSAAPFSTVCVTPFSFLLLWMYTKNLDQLGPRASLKYSSLLFAFLMAFGAFLLQLLETKLSIQVTIFILNVAESGFVQLLCTQHWSFIGSICNQEGAIWFAPIAGIGSVASALAALGISPLVDRIGLIGLLWTSVFFIVASCAAADDAYRISQVVGNLPIIFYLSHLLGKSVQGS